MGNVCCEEPKNIGNIDLYNIPPPEKMSYVPVDNPKITNSLVNNRLKELEPRKLEYDENKYPNVKMRESLKEIHKNFVYTGSWNGEVPEGKGNVIFENQ